MASTPYPRSDRDLLRRIARSAGGKAGYKQLVRELGLGGGRERRLLVEQLTRMVARGELVRSGEMWSLPVRTETAKSASKSEFERNNGLDFERRSGRDRLISGRLDLHRDGFGFVRPDSGTAGKADDIFIPPNEIHGAMQGDLVLVDEAPPGRDGRRSGRIARVLTRRNPTVVGIFHYARPRGRSVDFEGFIGNYVTPLDERIGGPIAIAPGDEIVAAPAASPHRMLGDEARKIIEKHTLMEDHPALEGLAVDVEITSFPAPGRPARGRLIEVLGPPGAFGVDVEIVIRKHHIPHAFPAPVLAEAEDRAAQTVASLAPEELAQREDFRGLPVVTIDGETARDFDDAVLVRDLPNGNSELQVHIADVSHYVVSGSALDTEARVRGTSVYFPDRAVPMLPHALSSGMCSLLPNEDRLALSCIMEIDAEGEIVGYRVAEGMIRSVRRMTYTSVQHCIDAGRSAKNEGQSYAQKRDFDANLMPFTDTSGGTDTATPHLDREPSKVGAPGGGGGPETQIPFGDDNQKSNSKRTGKNGGSEEAVPSAEDVAERERVEFESPGLPEAVDRMVALALRLNAKRVRRGSIDFDLPEPVVEFDPEGNMKAIVRSERGWAHRLIEEFMLSANECVAHWLEGQGIASIYRIHEMPDPKRIVDFEETASQFGHSLGIASLPVRSFTMKADRRDARQRSARGKNGGRAQQHEVPQRIPVTPQMYQRLVRRISGTAEERILAYLMLRSLKQARYAAQNEGHFALASPSYTHFTSPIRRYPDLIVHRLVRAMLRGGAEARGGAIRSDDAQPWGGKAGVRDQGAGIRDQGAGVRGLSTAAQERASGRDDGVEGGAGGSDSASEMRGSFAPLRMTAKDDLRMTAKHDLRMTAKHDLRVTAKDDLRVTAKDEGPISAEELNDIAVESSQAERRAADAERELMEWKKMRFMEDKVGEDFAAVILSCTKYGFFVELDAMFIEGLVPMGSLAGDHYTFRDTDRTIVGARTGHVFGIGQRVQVLLDRIDRQQRRLQFALLPGTEPGARNGATPPIRKTTPGSRKRSSRSARRDGAP